MANGNNATDAYMRAYPNTTTRATGRVNGSRLLEHPDVQEYLKERYSEAVMSANECLGRLSRQARGSMAKFIEIDPVTGKPTLDMKGVVTSDLDLISKFQEVETPVGKDGLMKKSTTIELYSAQEALRTVAKSMGLLDDVSQSQFQKQVDTVMALLQKHLEASVFDKVIQVLTMANSRNASDGESPAPAKRIAKKR